MKQKMFEMVAELKDKKSPPLGSISLPNIGHLPNPPSSLIIISCTVNTKLFFISKEKML
jgi:hypothetical protein